MMSQRIRNLSRELETIINNRMEILKLKQDASEITLVIGTLREAEDQILALMHNIQHNIYDDWHQLPLSRWSVFSFAYCSVCMRN